MTAPIVIIGTGLAGYSLARELRKLTPDLPLVLLTRDDGHAYSKPLLSTAFARHKTPDELSTGDPGQMAEALNATVRTFCTVDAIEPRQKVLHIGSERLAYDKLVLATGASVRQLTIPGANHPRVYSINSLMDFRRFHAAVQGKRKIAIIGAGLIGCEYANDLIAGGFEVDLITPSATPLNALIPPRAGQVLADGLVAAGIGLRLQRIPVAIHELDTGLAIELDNGQRIVADAVVSAIGIQADICLALTAGLRTRTGIITDATLQTSTPDIYALGDCAEIEGRIRYYVMPLMASARALAQTLNGNPTPISFGAMPVATKTPACPIIACPPEPGVEGEWQTEGHDPNLILRFVDAQNQLRGFVLTGECIKEKQGLGKVLVL
jgi:rubredoxin-NAD+ reductase